MMLTIDIYETGPVTDEAVAGFEDVEETDAETDVLDDAVGVL